MAKYYNLARMLTPTTGTGTVTLNGAAVTGYNTWIDAGIQDGDVVSYGIKDGNSHEAGRGTFTASGSTLTRGVVSSTNGDSALDLSGNAEVYITAISTDFEESLTLANTSGSIAAEGYIPIGISGSKIHEDWIPVLTDYYLQSAFVDIGGVVGAANKPVKTHTEIGQLHSSFLQLATTGSKGAMPILSGSPTDFLGGDGNWRPLAGRNFIINGNFDYWQRGDTLSPGGQWAADRFRGSHSTDGTIDTNRSTLVPTLAQSGFQSTYSMQMDVTTLDSSIDVAQYCYFRTGAIEGFDYAKLKDKTVTLSFWVYATKTGTYCVSFRNSGADRTYVVEYTVSTTLTWEKKTITVTLDQTGGTENYTNGAGLYILWAVAAGTDLQATADTWQSGTYIATSNQVNMMDSASNMFHLAQVKLEIGSEATEFSRTGNTIQEELVLCQRYFFKTYDQEFRPGYVGENGGSIYGRSSGTGDQYVYLPLRMRTGGTAFCYSPDTGTVAKGRDVSGNADVDAAAFTAENGAQVRVSTTSDQRLFRVHVTVASEL